MRSSIRCRAIVALTIAASAGVAPMVVLAPPAAAGGGCHRPMSGQTEGNGTSVDLAENCMTPTVLRTKTGETVTFVNRDGVMHNIYGIGWGTDSVQPAATLRQRFDTDGIYPYACTLHPGMLGAIVVGDGSGAGAVAAAGRLSGESQSPPPVAATETSTSDGGISPISLVVGAGAVVLAFGLAAGIAFRRTRRPVPLPS